uniref:SFRICE_000685 n=1 Tax=Spodoptera frugiperda TaxID=7108 RepID=A0A2H1V088_SPOFR
MKKNKKELAMVNGFTFYCHKNNAKTKIWTCTSGWLCKARLITSMKFVKRVNGKEVALVNGYTYYCRKQSLKKSTKIWNCTYGGTCHARMEITNHVKPSRRIVLSAKLEHKHEPSEYCISNGFYVKL